jgi:hypothetical protein
MPEQLYFIVESCIGTPVTGCESMTIEQVEEWLSIHQEHLEIPNSCGDTVKYINVALGQSWD